LCGGDIHIGARVASVAAPGEVLVSQTVRDLVAGSGLEFEERGPHRLKGVPNEWHLFRAVSELTRTLNAADASPNTSRSEVCYEDLMEAQCSAHVGPVEQVLG
jgi:hypothetical protein